MSHFPIEPLQNSAKGWRSWTMKTGNTKIQVTSTQEGLRSRRACFDARPTCFRGGFNRFTQIHFILGEKSSNVGLRDSWSPNWTPYMFMSPSWTGKTKLSVKLSFELLQKVAVPKVSENTLRRTVTLLFEDSNRWGVLVWLQPLAPSSPAPQGNSCYALCSSNSLFRMTTAQSEKRHGAVADLDTALQNAESNHFRACGLVKCSSKTTHLLFSQIRISQSSPVTVTVSQFWRNTLSAPVSDIGVR